MSIKKKRVFLHIGTRKTGSSFIQNFCQQNRQLLLDLDFYYPDNDFFGERKGKSSGHWNLYRAFNGQQGYSIKRYLPSECPADNVILSNEALSSEHCEVFKMADNVHHMLSEKFHVIVIIYLRRQDHLIASLYSEGIVSGNRKAMWSLSEFLEGGHLPEIDYYKLLQSWANVFGKENIIVRPFETQQFYKRDLLRDFIHSIGIEWQERFAIPSEEYKNPSPDIVLVEALRQINRIPIQLPFYRQFLENVFQEFVFSGQYQNNVPQSIMKPSDRLGILNQYALSNALIAREFLGRNDGKLFYEPEPDKNEPWTPVTIDNPEFILQLFSLFFEKKSTEIHEDLKKNTIKIIEQEKHVDSLDQRITGQEKHIDSLDQRITGQEKHIDSLDQRITGQEKHIDSLDQRITGQEKQIDRYEQLIAKQEEQYKVLFKRQQEGQLTQNLLYRHILSVYRLARKSPWKRLYRFLRSPILNEAKVIRNTGLVDPHFYFSNYPQSITAGITAAEHYVRYGAQQGNNPSAEFNTQQYLAQYPETAHAGINPLVHFILTGQNISRK